MIIELSKKKCVFDSPLMIESEVLFNSKVNLYNYMYNHIPRLFGRENIYFFLSEIQIQLCTKLKTVLMKII